MARTQSTLHQLLHLLQHLASQRGLYMNPNKCELLRLNSNLPICLSHSTSPASCCSCCFCCDFTTLTPTENSLADPLPVVDTAKYLGAMIPANSSSNADLAYRYSQAATAFRCLFPVFTHPQIHPKRKLQIYAQIVMTILLHGSESQVYTPAQLTKLNSLHYKVLRQILQIKSSYYHRFWTSLALIAPTTSVATGFCPSPRSLAPQSANVQKPPRVSWPHTPSPDLH